MKNKRVREKCGKCGKPADVKERNTFLCAGCHIEKEHARELKSEFNNARFRDVLR